ncbi:hypothetical protein CDAR_29821 [Caerostris darwini]|uniref:Uncharacterized protein n=1 Tax=Caerostris darwini TaxID=1538125 RepID=A0AAV4QRM0_9ARAC|nr:hypothetical protein CDAR_29821 [Caerostris darwini]
MSQANREIAPRCLSAAQCPNAAAHNMSSGICFPFTLMRGRDSPTQKGCDCATVRAFSFPKGWNPFFIYYTCVRLIEREKKVAMVTRRNVGGMWYMCCGL